MDRKKRLSSAAVLSAGVLWGSMGIFVRQFNAVGVQTMNIVGLRAFGTAAFLLIILGITNRDSLRIRIKDLWCFLGTGIASIVFFNYCYYRSIVLTDLSTAAVLLYTAPSMVMIMSAVLFHEKFTKVKALAVILAFLGCVFVTGIVGTGMNLNMGGILVGLGSGFGYALYSIFSRMALQRGYSSMTISLYTFLFAALGVLPFIDVKEMAVGVMAVPGGVLFYIAFIFFTTVLAYFLYTWGMEGVDTGTASILASVEPVVATLIGVFLFHEGMGLLQGTGIIMVIGSIILCNRN